MAVDINGLPQAILVTRANVSDRSGALAMFSLASQNLELVQHVMVDGGYTGNDFADQVKLILNAKTTVAKRNELHMFTVLPQRWIVERSWSWLDKCRRLWKNCERALNSSLQMVVLAFLKIVLKRYQTGSKADAAKSRENSSQKSENGKVGLTKLSSSNGNTATQSNTDLSKTVESKDVNAAKKMANTLSNSSEDQLPQAGDRHESALGVLGAIAIALSALLGLNLRKFKVTK